MSESHSVPAVAKMLGVTRETVRILIRERKLRAIDVSTQRVMPRWRIPDESLQAFVRARANIEESVHA